MIHLHYKKEPFFWEGSFFIALHFKNWEIFVRILQE